MARVRINPGVAITLVTVIAILIAAIVLKRVSNAMADTREGSMLRDAARFISDNGVERTAEPLRFVPLPTDKQVKFESTFRDRSDVPIIYDPWTPQGDPIVQSASNHRDIVAYTLTLTPAGQRAILTAGLGIYYVPDSQIDWSARQWTVAATTAP